MAVGTSNYPTSLDTVVELIQAANNAQTTLNGDLTANATTIAVISTALFNNTGSFAIGNELISYTGKTATSFTGCVRGFDGTTAASHSSGSVVADVVTTAHHEVLVSAILSLQQKLGTGASNPSLGTVLKGTGAGSSAYAAITASEIDLTDSIVNADISASAAIAYSKLNLSGSIVNADVNASAAINYSKLSLTGSIVDADVSASAAIAYSKLANLTTGRLLTSDGSGKVSASSLTWDGTNSIIGAVSGIDFNGVELTPQANRILWSSDYNTLMLGLTSAVSIPIGQSDATQVKSSTNGGLLKGKVVYVVGSDGANKTVAYAQADSGTTCKTTLGIVAETTTGSSKAFTVTRGIIRGLNTDNLTEGQPVYLSSSSAGDMVDTAPTPPNHRVKIGYCVNKDANQGVIFVDVQTGYDVGELCDAAITGTPVAGSLLIRNATAGTWVNATLTAGSGVSVTNGDGSITIAATGAAAGSAGDYQINSGSGFAAGVLTESSGRLTATPTAVTSGVAPYLRIITPADTDLTASTEAPGIVFGGDGSGSTVTRTRAAGATTLQREYIFTAPTYAAASATTITTAATLAVTGAPIAGSNVTLTESFAAIFRTDTSALVASIAFQNNNASGWNGISFRNNSGTGRAGIVYAPGTPDSLRIYYPVSGGGNFYIADPSAACFVATSNYQICMGGTTSDIISSSMTTIRNISGASNVALSVRHTHATPTVNTFQVTSGTTIRYGVFCTTTESRTRLIGNNGGQQDRSMLSELVTLSTVGATTDTTIQIPANSLVLGVTVRVTTGITGIDSTALEIGDATTSNRFGSIAAFTAGTTGVGLNHLQGGISTDAAGPIVTSATAVRLTLAGGADNTPSAGAVRVTIHYISLTAPTS